MVDDQQVMYDGFSNKGEHSAGWLEIMKNFLKLAFAGDHCEAKCPCNRCRNKRMLSKYEMSDLIAKQGFISNYLVWHQHVEVQAPVADVSDRSDDEDRMDDMIADISMKYELGSRDQHLLLECILSIGSLPPLVKKRTMASI
jgi:hypothetical protein